jgi:Flp pilus assembly secretin CpaC
MIEGKHRRGSEGTGDSRPESTGLLLTPTQIEVGSGYTVAISYDEDEKQIVNVKTYGEIDAAKLQREIRRVFPKAKIKQVRNAAHAAKTRKKMAMKQKESKNRF